MPPTENHRSVPYLSPAELANATGDYEAAGIMPLARQLEDKLSIEEKIERFTPIQTLPVPLNPSRWPADAWAEMEAIRKGEKL